MANSGGGSTPSDQEPPAELLGVLTDDAFDRDALALAEQSAGIGVWSIDLTTGLARGTAQFFRIFGLPPTRDPVPMDRVRALRHPDDRERVLAGFRQALEDGTDTYEIEYRIVRPDGDLRWIFGRGRVVRDASGRPIRYSGVDLDITHRKAVEAALEAAKEELERMNQVLEQRVRERTAELEAEAQRRADVESRLHQAQKMEAVGQLTGGIAHDFNNILQIIVGNLEIATLTLHRDEANAPRGFDRARLVNAIETAQRASRSARQLVHRLLAFSRLQTLEPAPLDANTLVSEMSEMMQTTLGETIEMRTMLAHGLWPTFVDRNQLETALLNLIVNARDAMPGGGRLEIETSNVTIPAATPDDVARGDYVVLRVADTGSGIPSENLGRVFEPFFTTKDAGKGSGLGLSMVYGFVQQSGGYVRIESEVDSGSTVRIFLPRSTRAAIEHPAVAGTPPRAFARARAGETVLLVEDNDDVRRFGVSALDNLGYRVLEACDGPSALRLLDTLSGAPVHLLFTDVILPGGMTGTALAEAFRARRPRVPVLFTSGYTRNAMLQQGNPLGDCRLLAKPYSIDKLAVSVREALDANSAAAAALPESD